MKKSTAKSISRQEIEQAMQDFLKHGGKITTLPPEKVADKSTIGGDNLSAYESFHNVTLAR